MAMQPFVWGGNTGQRMTPQQVERERVAQALMAKQAGDTSPVASPFAGLNRVLQGYISGRDRSRIDSAEEAGINSARERVAAALGADFGDVTPTQSQIAAPAAQIPSGEMATAVLEGLIQRGMPEHIAQGFLMNFQDESGLNPGINEQNPLVPGSRGGFGLSQWTGPRRRELEAFANQRGVPVSDVDAQLDFLMSELQGSERGAWNKIANTQDAGSAAAAIVNSFLRPAEEHRARREAQYLGAGAQPASGGASSNALLALAADPWVAQQYGGVIEALAGQAQQRENMALQQQYKQADPMYQAQLAQLTRATVNEYDQRAAAAQQYGLTGDQATAFALTGNIPGMGGAGLPAEIQALQWRAQESGLQPGTQEYQEFVRNGGRVTNGMPAAVAALHEQALRSGLVEGSPEYQNFMLTRGAGQVAGAATTGKAEAEMALAAPAEVNSADDTLRYIQELRDHPGRKAGTGASSWTSMIPGTAAKDFGVRVAQLEGGAFLTAIGEMQGMGALSNQEGQTAKAAIARLNTATTEEGFMAALDDYERIIRRGRDRAQKRIKVSDASASQAAPEASDDDLMRKYGIQ